MRGKSIPLERSITLFCLVYQGGGAGWSPDRGSGKWTWLSISPFEILATRQSWRKVEGLVEGEALILSQFKDSPQPRSCCSQVFFFGLTIKIISPIVKFHDLQSQLERVITFYSKSTDPIRVPAWTAPDRNILLGLEQNYLGAGWSQDRGSGKWAWSS